MDDYDNFAAEPNEYFSFIFSFIPLPAPEGGDDDENDCLIKCIKKVIRTKKNEILADELKQILKLKRDSKIPISKMNKVEEYIFEKTGTKYGINISGDYEYNSTVETTKFINLILSKEHYSLDECKDTKRSHHSHSDRQVNIYYWNDEKLLCDDGDEEYEMDQEEFKNIMAQPKTAKKILISKSKLKKTI
jgi:hypothetical protein